MSDTIKDQETSSEQGNPGRRRLVRGAVALAPLVLTLRSGAAAASCTGVKIREVSVKSADPGPGNDPSAGELLNPSKPLEAGDVCVGPGQLTQCDSNPDKVQTFSNLNTLNSEPVVKQGNIYTCGENRQFQGQNVAILSSQSVSSMGVDVVQTQSNRRGG